MADLEPTAEELAALLDKQVYGTGEGALTDAQRAEKVFRDHAYNAAVSIVGLAKHANSETVRLNAGKYVIDRACGPLTKDGGPKDDEKDPLVDAMKLLDEAIKADPR